MQSIKWEMIDFDTFKSIQGEYTLNVFGRTLWSITKDGDVLVDICYYHPHIPKSESDAKVKCQNAFYKIINTAK